ncbi:MAG TPA: hypothetical protein VGJ18_22195 [Gemmatimonadaceae bacterium]|jgi:hypothetical protein
MRARQAHHLVLLASLLSAACGHSFTREDALTAIQHSDSLLSVLSPDSERVAHETVADCRAIYSDNADSAHVAGDSAWILLSGAGWMDLADVDAPSDPRQKKHCRAVLTGKADKAAFVEAQDTSGSPWTSYWTVETAHTKAEIVGLPKDSIRNDSAVAEFQFTQERTALGELLHRPKWTAESERLLSTTLRGHFRHYDDGWRLESFDDAR